MTSGTPDADVEQIRAAEAVRSCELAAQRRLLRRRQPEPVTVTGPMFR
jgi:hypothetical protein